jgi:hypothetical protein
MNKRINLSDELRLKKKITEEFEVMLGGLTLEEIIGLKLEVSAGNLKGKLFGINLLDSLRKSSKDAAFSYVLNFCKNEQTAALLLGLTAHEYKVAKHKFLKDKKMEELDGEL